VLGATFNSGGALSHNLADLAGAGGAGFNMAPSLTGSLTLALTPSVSASHWDVSVTDLAYTGQATPVMYMNQFLVKPGSPATQTATYNVDGSGNSGAWQASAAGNWAITYGLDFYFATNADGVPDANDIDMTFNDTQQQGYLIPVSQLTVAGLGALSLDDPAGYFAGDFATYLLDVVAPLLPGDATYLLLTQMGKVHADYAELGLPVTTAALIGNTTIAYTTTAIPEPASLALLAVGVVSLTIRRRRSQH
jgi:hypothetical protein